MFRRCRREALEMKREVYSTIAINLHFNISAYGIVFPQITLNSEILLNW